MNTNNKHKLALVPACRAFQALQDGTNLIFNKSMIENENEPARSKFEILEPNFKCRLCESNISLGLGHRIKSFTYMDRELYSLSTSYNPGTVNNKTWEMASNSCHLSNFFAQTNKTACNSSNCNLQLLLLMRKENTPASTTSWSKVEFLKEFINKVYYLYIFDVFINKYTHKTIPYQCTYTHCTKYMSNTPSYHYKTTSYTNTCASH
jgi:hypothetical protein